MNVFFALLCYQLKEVLRGWPLQKRCSGSVVKGKLCMQKVLSSIPGVSGLKDLNSRLYGGGGGTFSAQDSTKASASSIRQYRAIWTNGATIYMATSNDAIYKESWVVH